MSKPRHDLSYIRASLDELAAYLLSKELFWTVSTPAKVRSFPKLTIASLLLAMKKLAAISNPEIAQLSQDIEDFHLKWKTAWENKAKREFTSRLRQWSHYLNDLEKNEDTHAPYYPSEVRVRVLIAILSEFAEENELLTLSQLDLNLQSKLKPADFIWDAELQPEFPPEDYWFLYGKV